MSAPPTSPVRIEGRLEPELSRWLWVVKWLLAIPHYIVLAFLWIAFFVLTIVAFFAILFTGRYPRGIFDFNLGVLRWTWRVGFYSYAALGTDRYPPFTLGPEPDYPATLDVEYPERLSRGLVLVKWWLLAIPQYIVVGFLLGGGGWRGGRGERRWHWGWGAGGGLIGVLVLFAGVALLFMSRYPLGIFDFVLGLDRWVARVAAYAGLMTDAYPPFRLDQGGDDTGTPSIPEAPVPAPAADETADTAALAGETAARAGDLRRRRGTGGAVHPRQPRGTAFARVPRGRWRADRRRPDAARRRRFPHVADGGLLDRDLRDRLRERRRRLRRLGPGCGRVPRDGAHPQRERAPGVRRDRLRHGRRRVPGRGGALGRHEARQPAVRRPRGRSARKPSGSETFWVASTSGSGEQTLEWDPEEGSWSAVVMNADGSRGVAAELSIGAELDSLIWIGIGMLVVGGLLAAAAALAITAGARRGRH